MSVTKNTREGAETETQTIWTIFENTSYISWIILVSDEGAASPLAR
jgi:hypothetical protein